MTEARNGRIKRNADVLEGMIVARELHLKGTAPSFLNLESDRPAPGSSPTFSSKGMDAVDAHLEARERETGVDLMVLNAEHALHHVRRDWFPHWYAMLRAQNDPGVVQRGKDPRATENDEAVRSLFQQGCLKACEYLEATRPGARLWRLSARREHEPVDAPKAGSWKRGAVLQEKRWDWEDSARRVGQEIDAIRNTEGCGVEAAKGLLIDRKGLGPREVDRKWDFYRDEKAREGEGVA